MGMNEAVTYMHSINGLFVFKVTGFFWYQGFTYFVLAFEKLGGFLPNYINITTFTFSKKRQNQHISLTLPQCGMLKTMILNSSSCNKKALFVP